MIDHIQTPSHGKIRKLSVTVTLSDPKDYKGGELEFDFRNKDPKEKRNVVRCTEILPKGSLVVFPGFVWHRVCPVKKDLFSLCRSCNGDPFSESITNNAARNRPKFNSNLFIC